MKAQTITTATLDQFITDLDYCDLDQVRALWQHAKGQGGDFAEREALQPMWRDMASLLAREIKRY